MARVVASERVLDAIDLNGYFAFQHDVDFFGRPGIVLCAAARQKDRKPDPGATMSLCLGTG